MGLALLAASCSPSGEPPTAPARQDNAVLVTVEGLPWSLVQEGLERGGLPALAALQEQALSWTRCRAPSSSVQASLASLLTGQAPWEHGVRWDDLFGLPETTPTLATALRDRGAKGAAVLADARLVPAGLTCALQEVRQPELETLSLELRGENAAPLPLRRTCEATADEAVEWLRQARSPFSLWVHLRISGWEGPGTTAAALRSQLGERLAALDRAVARLDQALQAGDRQRRTVFAVIGVRGELWGQEGRYDSDDSLDDAVLHVPAWIRVPDLAPEVQEGAVGLQHLTPILARHLGISAGVPAWRESAQEWGAECLAPLVDQGTTPRRRGASGPPDGGVFAPLRVPSPILEARLARWTGEFPDRAPPAEDPDFWSERSHLLAMLEQRSRPDPLLQDPGAPIWQQRDPADLRLEEAWLRLVCQSPEDLPDGGEGPWLGEMARNAPHRPFVNAQAANPLWNHADPAERLACATRALAQAPWLFPAVRSGATACQETLQIDGIVRLLEEFAARTRLSEPARSSWKEYRDWARATFGR